MLDKIRNSKKFRKAYIAAIIALLTPIGTALTAGTLTGAVALAAIGAAVLAGIAVYRVPNAKSDDAA